MTPELGRLRACGVAALGIILAGPALAATPTDAPPNGAHATIRDAELKKAFQRGFEWGRLAGKQDPATQDELDHCKERLGQADDIIFAHDGDRAAHCLSQIKAAEAGDVTFLRAVIDQCAR
jgi:hypothetical protein